jgi:Cu(I)/Ag(I) efflux system membrane protein CusA/SilA
VTTYDRSDLIRRAIATLREKLIEESVVVALVCLVFLWHIARRSLRLSRCRSPSFFPFVPMWWMHVTSNIMSLGGIAIAIGAMIDSAIIMIENAHKALEHFRDEHGREPNSLERVQVIIAGAKSVGRSLFFALLVITVSFVPVFTLTAQEGRLFRPLAFTKTFSMFFASFLGVTLVPVLMTLLIRGKITPEEKSGEPLPVPGLSSGRRLRPAISLVHSRLCTDCSSDHDLSLQKTGQRVHAPAE